MIDFQPHLSGRQGTAWDALYERAVREVLYGGAKGGGKSVLGCYWTFTRALETIREFDLRPTRYPPPVAFMGRKQRTDFVHTTLETWKDVIPDDAYVIREQASEIIIGNAVKIEFGGFDRTEAVRKFNSAEYCYFFIDQAEELTRDDVALLRATLRRRIGGRHVEYKGLFTANPAQCWLKPEFIENPADFRRFVRALPADNPFLSKAYVEQLKDAFRHRPDLLKAYLEGSWDASEAVGQVIMDAWIEASLHRTLLTGRGRKVIACDPARFGDDETVIYLLEETRIVETDCYGKKDLVHTANRLAVMSRQNGDCLVVVDEGGLGAGVVDMLRDLGVDVLGVNSAEKAGNAKKYGNKRAQMWDAAALMFADGDVELEEPLDTTLRGQLLTPRYDLRRGKLYIEEKEKIKARLGRSPDRADAYILGLWGLRYVEEEAAKEEFGRRRRESVGAMAM